MEIFRPSATPVPPPRIAELNLRYINWCFERDSRVLRIVMLPTALVALTALAIPQDAVLPRLATYDDAEAYKVYSTILPQEWPSRAADARTLVIRVETEPYKMCVKPDKESEKIVGSAIADYEKKNSRKWLLQRQFEIGKPYEMVSSNELDLIFKIQGSKGWPKFYVRHPDSGGWIELSAVGFNALKTIAVVYEGHSCGGLCGGGTFHILQKVNGKWIPLQFNGTSCAWAS